ncbi:putative immunity protein [Clavibacter sepedonicus]|uniref:Uncharacterized protein n=1 Tax=Clavibacter sepedonicus TaxID=31964 RepID=B0RJ29_CLASE|nr:hypothetical protein B5P19_15955 [Clavibacter sepedonicus]OQJ50896.1 hypothetical protein B5P20_15795 [Clavibacter sepedonicus]CAQ03218.1 hypothetical protein pCS0035 [Clavibacter sepedonicus]
MTECRSAAHAAARGSGRRRRGNRRCSSGRQEASVAHKFDYSPHAATYATKAIALHESGVADLETERQRQRDSPDWSLRPIKLPNGR